MSEQKEEEWKEVVGYEGLYEVSNLGRLRSSLVGKHKPKRILRLCVNSAGYFLIKLFHNGKYSRASVHRLVASSFIPIITGKTEINHKDGNKLNNCVSNLEWCTRSENTKHAYDSGLIEPLNGSDNPGSKLTDEQVNRIRRAWDYRRSSVSDLARVYNVSKSTINRIINKQSWRYLQVIAVAVIFSCCSPAAKLRRAEKLIKSAEFAGATWKSDTVFTEVPVIRTEIRVDSTIIVKPGDSVVIFKERVEVKIKRLLGDTVFVDVKVPADTIKITVPTIINREITADCRIKWWWVLIGFLVGVMLGRLVLKMLI